jgi:hypothetical protein
MTEPSPFERVQFPPIPDSGIIPGATAEEVIGLALTPPLLAMLETAETRLQARLAEQHVWLHGTGAIDVSDFDVPAFVRSASPLQLGQHMIAYMGVPNELLDDTVTVDFRPTSEMWKASAERRQAALQAERDAKFTSAADEWETLRAHHADSPAIAAVLDLHQPTDRLECTHEVFGYEADAEDWPCSTYLAIRDAER